MPFPTTLLDYPAVSPAGLLTAAKMTGAFLLPIVYKLMLIIIGSLAKIIHGHCRKFKSKRYKDINKISSFNNKNY